ncbi:MAG TPA: hypothetical protein VFY10_00785 [Dehalococcoidia bacterium]|nr:hypothetical protein [Dehalococcoidia bacterium]
MNGLGLAIGAGAVASLVGSRIWPDQQAPARARLMWLPAGFWLVFAMLMTSPTWRDGPGILFLAFVLLMVFPIRSRLELTDDGFIIRTKPFAGSEFTKLKNVSAELPEPGAMASKFIRIEVEAKRRRRNSSTPGREENRVLYLLTDDAPYIVEELKRRTSR